MDLYHSSVLGRTSAVHWVSATDFALHPEAGIGKVPAKFDRDRQKAIEALLDRGKDRSRMVGALGVVHQWRTASTAQVAAVLGDAHLGNPLAGVWLNLLALGLVDRGMVGGGLLRTASLSHARVVLHRPGQRMFWDRFAKNLTYPERVAITGGTMWQAHRQAARHNVLALEAGLKAVRQIGFTLALGDAFAGHDQLGFSALGYPYAPGWSNSGGDLVLVRGDGLRIVVEVTASGLFDKLSAKAAKWARLMAMRPLDVSGLAVVFLIVGGPDQTRRTNALLYEAARKAIIAAVRANPGTLHDRSAARFGLADWDDWFPAQGMSEHLMVRAPIGSGDDRWQSVDFFDPGVLELDAHTQQSLAGVFSAAPALAGTICKDRPPALGLHRLAAQRWGLDPQVLRPTPRRAGRNPFTRSLLAPLPLCDPLAEIRSQ